jgi:hypothetical protein
VAANTTHEVFVQPASPNAKVWRYMDFTKYVALLEAGALYFCRIDKLGDPFEGSTTVASKKAWEALFANPSLQQISDWQASMAGFRRLVREGNFANCWHAAEHESAAMWRLYSGADEAIAIQTSYARLVHALPEKVMVGLVKYIDYDSAKMPGNNMLWPIMHKRLSFEHEHEVRAVLMAMEETTSGQSGRNVVVDLNALIERVYVSPSSPDWYYELVGTITAKLGFGFPMARSRLSEQPVL